MAKSQEDSDLDKPEEMFAWMFAAGVPDPRAGGDKFPNQPLIPPQCWPAFSAMLYKMGARFHPDLQEMWVKPGGGLLSNFQANGVTDIRPSDIEGDAAGMLAEQFPDVAARVAQVTPDTHAEALREQSDALMDSLERLRAARAAIEDRQGGGANDDA